MGEYGEADPYYILADFPSYIETYEKVYHLYVDHKDEWIKKAIVNTAKSGYFSSDRTIEQYNEKNLESETSKIRVTKKMRLNYDS